MVFASDPENLFPGSGDNDSMNGQGIVSAIHKCQSKDARKLCIYDPVYKIKTSKKNYYDIGGTYTNTESDLWFYITTLSFSEEKYLVSLFVCHRKIGNAAITVNFNGITQKQILKSFHPNENYHLKTFCLNEEDIQLLLYRNMYIYVSIDIEPSQLIDNEIIKRIKLQQNLSEGLLKQAKTDFILESASKKRFPTHKIVVAAHSPVLRAKIGSGETSVFIDLSDETMELLLEFLYKGTISNIKERDCMQLQEVADNLKLENLFLLTQYAFGKQIKKDNAIKIAQLAKKYNLEKLWSEVCVFIKKNPEVMNTEGWKALTDVELAKELCQQFVK
ncbi:uncharacterized protein LOC131850338 [Achroia grisella]|uniref:uncharacterized protein LOC131850338 n=1 Tax=Achroia grisella TaxID=688607 RepID=UPI0027D1FBA6|nr:uncharacterized protein LOC131850338 [Achroia grisella]XP_059056523.1 uncharacterized protein LOC131850338 [Achroia grisella]XP_059056524.1 uncharacterized protein LOC131850338 [Achroia grisella]